MYTTTPAPSSASNDPVPELRSFILDELDHFQRNFQISSAGALTYFTQAQLKDEPFIGYMEVTGQDDYRYMLVCRNYTPTDLKPRHPNCDFVSYYSPVGALISSLAGEMREVVIPAKPTTKRVRLAIKTKNTFTPKLVGNQWDALKNDITWIGGRRFVPSLREFQQEQAKVLRREVAEKVQLPDQAILDVTQDATFRAPLNRCIVVSGAPGTGKTTVLIKRLAQKTKYEFLSDDEKRLVDHSAWQENRNWVLFTPSDLLRSYLKESLGRDHLPATDQTVRVWSQYRCDLLRDLGFLKAGASGYFTRMPESRFLLKRPSNTDAVALAKAFKASLANQLDQYYRNEYNKFGERIRPTLAELRGGMRAVMEKALDYLTGAAKGDEQQVDAVKMGTEYRLKAQQIDELCRYAEGIAARADKQYEGLLGPEVASQIARNTSSSRLRILSQLELPEHLFPSLTKEVSALTNRIEALVETIGFGTVFSRIPLFFQEFRTNDKNVSRFYHEDAVTKINERKIDAMEMDALLWSTLEIVSENETFAREAERQPSHSSRAAFLLAQRRGMIAVDEATDFSAVELGCMRRLADPAFASLTLSGDPMQRLTPQGIQDWDDIAEMVGEFHISMLKRSYRQTARLLNMAAELYRNSMGKEPPFESAYIPDANDPPPLAFKPRPDYSAEQWITERIVEIWENNEKRLPSVGVIVPDAADESGWVEKLHATLYENAINVEGSANGQSLGNTDRVRVFPVSSIKGLEFEAAFFVEIDRMAEKAPTLIDRYLYVGLSRARSHLGVTYNTQFPRRLHCVREQFSKRITFHGSE